MMASHYRISFLEPGGHDPKGSRRSKKKKYYERLFTEKTYIFYINQKMDVVRIEFFVLIP